MSGFTSFNEGWFTKNNTKLATSEEELVPPQAGPFDHFQWPFIKQKATTLPLPVIVVTIIIGLGYLVWTIFSLIHCFIYFTHDEENYFNDAYANDNNIIWVILHTVNGLLPFFLGPAFFLLKIFSRSVILLRVFGLVYVIIVPLLVVSAIPLFGISILSTVGKGIMIVTMMWMLSIPVTGIVAIFFLFRKNEVRFYNWFLRNVGVVMYGTFLLPILSNLLPSPVGDAIALAIAFCVICGTIEIFLWWLHKKPASPMK